MLSSTFSSKNPAGRTGVLLLTLALVSLCCVVELTAAIGFNRVSRIQQRIDRARQIALSLGPVDSRGRPNVLVVGNSLPLNAFNMQQLQDGLQDRFAVQSYFIEQTSAMDWYYGLRRLFGEGARPRVIMLSLGTNNLFTTGVRDEYFARFMLRTQDLPDLVTRQGLNWTQASNLLFGNVSAWFGAKSEIRKFLLFETLPEMDKLALLVAPGGPKRPEISTLRAAFEERLRMLREVCDQNGAALIFVIPPTLDRDDPYELLQALGRDAGVPVLMPIPPGESPATEYLEDHYHSNPQGAIHFTQALVEELKTLPELGSVR